MTARTPKQEILSEMARELALRRNYQQHRNESDENTMLLQHAYDFVRETMPDDYRPKTY